MILTILGVLIIVLSFSYAFFKPILDKERSTKVEVVAKTVDQLMFIQGDHLSIELNHLNFAEGEGNVTGSTTTTAKLIANNKTNTATSSYYVYFYIGKNEFDYSTPTNEPEIILTLKNPNGTTITSLPNMTYVTRADVSGFDITNYEGLITIAEEYSISTTSSTTGTSQEWEATVTIRNLDEDQSQQAGNILSAQFVFSNEEKETFSFEDLILANNMGKQYIDLKTSPIFNYAATTNEGMYSFPDDYGTSYYFRGAVDNNWVYFAGFYWRIVRINGDGSIKLIYTGTKAPTESERVVMVDEVKIIELFANPELVGQASMYCTYDGSSPITYEQLVCLNSYVSSSVDFSTRIGLFSFNLFSNSGEYVGYMYEMNNPRGHQHSSAIKKFIDMWYTNNLSSYSNFLSDFIVCNDRDFTPWTPVGLPENGAFSAAAGRNADMPISYPQLECSNKEDAYTVSDRINGNGQLTNPIGLLTADEVTLVGGYYDQANSDYYLYTNDDYWLISPTAFLSSDFGGLIVSLSGSFGGKNVDDFATGVRPVISLSSDVVVSGTGHWNDPYVVD